jgi:tetratricopeptide (TPR) repeat protein
MSVGIDNPTAATLAGLRIAIVGRLAGMSKRDAQQLIRQYGGVPVERTDENCGCIVIGEDLPVPIDPASTGLFDEPTQVAIDEGTIEVVAESEFWQRLGLVDDQEHIRRLYTPAMLADLIGVPVSIVRRWHRRGLIKPAREVRRLPYFDFQEVATARRLAELLAAGVSPATIERKLAVMACYVPGAQRPLAQLSIIVRGSRLLLRQGDGLIGPGGQLFFDFDVTDAAAESSAKAALAERPTISLADALRSAAAPLKPDEMLSLAAELEDDGEILAAVEAYRAHAAAAGPAANVCFAMAELLYRLGEVPAARERYFMAIELDEDYVEARSNLGCVLAELGDLELAVAAFEGALALHPDYADAHFHLGRTLDELARHDEAIPHWREFLRLAPESPWAVAAHERLNDAPVPVARKSDE